MKRTRLRRVSKSKGKANSLYSASKRQLWNELCEEQGRPKKLGPLCQRCGARPATDPHHKAGRRGVLLWCKEYLSWICWECHLGPDGVHANPSKAREEGWIIDISRDELYQIELEEKPKLWANK